MSGSAGTNKQMMWLHRSRRPGGDHEGLRFLRDPMAMALVVVIVMALGCAGVLGGELYARHRATSVVECFADDHASVSFGIRPLLLQLMTRNFSDIVIETAGNRFREAEGMRVRAQIADLRLPTANSSYGTLGSLDAEISWSNNGIKQTLQDTIPVFGALITAVRTEPSRGTIELQMGPSRIVTRPRVVDGGLALQALQVIGFGFAMPREGFQPQLDAFTSMATTHLPTGIHAESVYLTATGVNARFSARNANIAVPQADPCLRDL
jgi:DUF2993 family protein